MAIRGMTKCEELTAALLDPAAAFLLLAATSAPR